MRVAPAQSLANADIALFDGAGLSASRVHEALGPGARAFAAMIAGTAENRPVIWIRSARERRRLNPLGLADFLDPSRIVIAECDRPLDVLWCMEEALRFGGGAVVIAELASPMDLTVSRRLQLASEAGGSVGLAIVADAPVTNAAETRWFCAPFHHGEQSDSTLWRLSLIKNKKGTFGAWEIGWDAATRRIIVVSKIAGGPAVACGPYGGDAALRGRGGGKECAEA